jgi:hypothetical protein
MIILTVPLEGHAIAEGVGDESDYIHWSATTDRISAIAQSMEVADYQASFQTMSFDWEEGTVTIRITGLPSEVETAINGEVDGRTMATLRGDIGAGNYRKGY